MKILKIHIQITAENFKYYTNNTFKEKINVLKIALKINIYLGQVDLLTVIFGTFSKGAVVNKIGHQA